MKQQLLEAENRSLKQSLEVRTAAMELAQKALECCIADLSAMRDERDRLRAALEPFTKWKPSASWPGHEDQWNDVGLTVAHIRRARAALNPQEAEREIRHP